MAESDDIAVMTFELLKRIQKGQDELKLDMMDLKIRMSAMERHLGEQAVQIAALNGRMDRFDERLSRIERRLELTDA